MKIAFRADASLAIGTGHVMRCLTLGRVLRARGEECRFICRGHDGNLLHRIRESGFEAVELPLSCTKSPPPASDDHQLAHAAWLGASWQRDAEETAATLHGWAPDWLVVDHYATDKRWESALRPHCGRIMVIDDLADRDHDCDLLLDQNLVVDLQHRYDRRVPDGCAKLLGPEYALLQPEYAELHPRTPPRLGPVERILISFGGADQHNLTGRAIDAFLSLARSDIEVDVVINPASPYAPAIRRQVEAHANITLHEGIPTLAYLMLKADLAIGAAGATSWERCCMGLPTIAVVLASNQLPIATAIEAAGLAHVIDCHTNASSRTLAQAITLSLTSPRHTEASHKCLTIVDGSGAHRVADIMLLKCDTPLRIRYAALNDEALLLKWANDPAVRTSALTQERIDPSHHRRWFFRRLQDIGEHHLFIAETLQGLPIGQVRFDKSSNAWTLDYSLADFARGRRLASRMLTLAIRTMRARSPSADIRAVVKTLNRSSQRALVSAGFHQVNQTHHPSILELQHTGLPPESSSRADGKQGD